MEICRAFLTPLNPVSDADLDSSGISAASSDSDVPEGSEHSASEQVPVPVPSAQPTEAGTEVARHNSVSSASSGTSNNGPETQNPELVEELRASVRAFMNACGMALKVHAILIDRNDDLQDQLPFHQEMVNGFQRLYTELIPLIGDIPAMKGVIAAASRRSTHFPQQTKQHSFTGQSSQPQPQQQQVNVDTTAGQGNEKRGGSALVVTGPDASNPAGISREGGTVGQSGRTKFSWLRKNEDKEKEESSLSKKFKSLRKK